MKLVNTLKDKGVEIKDKVDLFPNFISESGTFDLFMPEDYHGSTDH